MIKKSFLLIFVFLIALSCNDDGMKPYNAIQVENGRLVFQDTKSFDATLSNLEKMDNEGLAGWRNNLAFNSMYKRLQEFYRAEASLPAEVVEFSVFPVAYTTILNGKAEVKIGDDIIWFNNGKKYRASTENELASVKLNPSEDFEVGGYNIIEIEGTIEGDEAGARYVKFSHNNPNVTYTNQSPDFTSCTDGKRRKFVDKLISMVEWTLGQGTYTAKLYLVLKVDYKNPSGDWVNSAALRHNYWYLQGNISSVDAWYGSSSVSYFSSVPTSPYGTTGTEDVWIPLSLDPTVKNTGRNGEFGYWEINMTGTITHNLVKPDGSYCTAQSWDNVWQ